MVEHHPVMGNLSVLLLDDNPTSLQIISNILVESGFKVFPFKTVETALDFVKSRATIEEELDLVLVEVHLRNIAPGSLGNSELLHHILNELQVPLITMCAYDDGEALSEHLTLGSCFHVLKPLCTGSLNMLKQKALEHKSKKATPQGLIPSRTKSRMVSSSAKSPQEMLILERNNLSNPGGNEFELTEVWKAHGCSNKPGRVRWTIELHDKFLDAVEVLGDKYATPKGILKLMNVNGLTSKHIASHLQKHRLHQRNAKKGAQHQTNASMEPVSELIGSAHNAATTESITPKVDLDIREVYYPSRLWTQVKEAAALKTRMFTCTSGIYRDDTKSVRYEYQKGLQKEFSASNRCWQQIGLSLPKCRLFAKNNVVVIDGAVSSEAPKAAGEMGYGASIGSSGSSSLPTSLVDQVVDNNRNEAAGNNDNVTCLTFCSYHNYVVDIDGGVASEAPKATGKIGYGASTDSSRSSSLSTSLVDQVGENYRTEAAGSDNVGNIDMLEGTMNKEHTAAMDTSDVWALLQTDDFDLIDATEEEISYWMSQLEGLEDQQNPVMPTANAQNGPVDNPVMPIAQDDGFSQDQHNLGLEDPLQVDNAGNRGLESLSLININGSMAQETTIQSAPINPVTPIARNIMEFWS